MVARTNAHHTFAFEMFIKIVSFIVHRGVVIIVVGNGHDETDCISHSINNLGEGMNPIILPPAIGK